jgi:hypothetical protein
MENRMKKRVLMSSSLVLCLCLLILLLDGCINVGDAFKAKYERTESTSVPTADVAELDVETNVGSITVTGADVTDCDITAEITVKAKTKEEARKLAEEVKIEAETSGDKLTIKAKKPAALKKRSLAIDFKITAPKRLKLSCSTHVGTVKVSDIQGPIKANVNVGNIICEQVVADVELESNVGDVKVKYAGSAPGACNAEITTNVGSIRFTGPPELSAQVDASTNVGSIKTAQAITIVGKVGKSIEGKIGSGEGKIRLKTNVGSVEID